MANLITASEFATYRNISQKLDEAKINEDISLAEQSDLVQILGDFYFDVVENATNENWLTLMNGGSFEYLGYKYTHAGIKKLLADYTYARYVYSKNINDTAFGFVGKNYQDGTPVDRNVLKDLAKQAQMDAGTKFKYIELYLLSEQTLFSRYCKNKNKGTSFLTQRFSKL